MWLSTQVMDFFVIRVLSSGITGSLPRQRIGLIMGGVLSLSWKSKIKKEIMLKNTLHTDIMI